jgi:hypothetical protein
MMMESLRKQWDERRASAPLRAAMTFDGDWLVLGAGTRLASIARKERSIEKVANTADKGRLVALLSAAHGEPITPRALLLLLTFP